jgi:hypothetical protein
MNQRSPNFLNPGPSKGSAPVCYYCIVSYVQKAGLKDLYLSYFQEQPPEQFKIEIPKIPAYFTVCVTDNGGTFFST